MFDLPRALASQLHQKLSEFQEPEQSCTLEVHLKVTKKGPSSTTFTINPTQQCTTYRTETDTQNSKKNQPTNQIHGAILPADCQGGTTRAISGLNNILIWKFPQAHSCIQLLTRIYPLHHILHCPLHQSSSSDTHQSLQIVAAQTKPTQKQKKHTDPEN